MFSKLTICNLNLVFFVCSLLFQKKKKKKEPNIVPMNDVLFLFFRIKKNLKIITKQAQKFYNVLLVSNTISIRLRNITDYESIFLMQATLKTEDLLPTWIPTLSLP